MDFPRPHCCQLTRHCWIQFHAYWMHRGNTELLPCTEPLCRLNVSPSPAGNHHTGVGMCSAATGSSEAV